MAKMPQKKSEDNPNEWLNTYADMVTLLLTFFVLLFACSNLDETKLQLIFQAFQSRGQYLNTQVDDLDINASDTGGVTDDRPELEGGDDELPQSFEELYQYFADYIDDNNLSDSIALEQGAAHITIRFDDDVFFDGDSYFLKTAGKRVLDGIIPGIQFIQKYIQTMTISGHTALVADNTRAMQLSALRANSVHLYLMSRETIEYSKYRLKACGPNEPIASNDTSDGKAKNRRVEIMFLKSELDLTDDKVIQDILEVDHGLGSGKFDPEANNKPSDPSTLPDGSVDKVIGFIEDSIKDNTNDAPSQSDGPSIMDSSMFVTSSESDNSE